ncbi:hypothetical protein MYSTI_03790 [Myxococcus stipitatus DSM 14675]|uniref:Uncharacterized protein n=1 Tax=Myxococcus stipitatus (strain DSM 14675 / JCM 12634 / Mx s8) TaxID=1278073 RepID=L7U864_MYXSD|nr:hypothetical protein [Myxococcus stipitatus]AGC45096.1 hypothetical protein MYSTI_03790 [Myxococcus stipitatus DSM 14675]
MLIFLKAPSESNDVITTPITDVIFLDKTTRYTSKFKKLAVDAREIVPWYRLDADPMDFGKRLLREAATDKMCAALMARATEVWGVDFKIQGEEFVTKEVQAHYVKLLKVWLSPLSGSIGISDRRAHRATVDGPDGQYEQVWKKLALDKKALGDLEALDFFKGMNVAGRRDRSQIYRNVTEAARALVGEVTSWPSRSIEKLAVLSLLRSKALVDYQQQMLQAAAQALSDSSRTPAPRFKQWEYLPYYLRGKPLERTDEDTARPLVLGALYDALGEAMTKEGSDERKLIDDFKLFNKGDEYRRWRLLPPVVRNQVLISDLPRIMFDGKLESEHWRIQFKESALKTLSDKSVGIGGWDVKMKQHPAAVPHEPGHGPRDLFPFASGWSRNELCPNVISSRLMLAPLYAGTSGHNQGRILAWLELAKREKSLDAIPLGLVISAGYSVLWRLYYDKRVSGFHTMFETFQGTYVDTTVRDLRGLPRPAEDPVWSAVLDASPEGQTNVSTFWSTCIKLFGKTGQPVLHAFKSELAKSREAALVDFPGTVIPRWSTTDDVDATAPEVNTWA